MRPRLTFLIRDLGYGGAQRQLVTLAIALRDDFEITVVHFYPGPLETELRDAGIRTSCTRKKHRWDLAGFFFRLVRAVRATRPQILHSYLAESNLMSVLLRPFLGETRIVWGLRDSQTDAALWGLLGKWSFRLGCLLSGRADRIIANSRAGRDYYSSKGFPVEKIAVVPNGIDTGRFHVDAAAGSAFRKRWQQYSNGPVIGIVGRINPMKDHATFLRAAEMVLRRHPQATFICIGAEDSAHAAYAAEMRSLAASPDLAGKVVWNGPTDAMPAVYNALDLLVSASAFGEGFPNVVAEAMACGVPCVVTDVGDSAWLVSETALVVPPRQPEQLANAISNYLDLDDSSRTSLKLRARRRLEENFSVSRMARRTREILDQVSPPVESTPLRASLEVMP